MPREYCQLEALILSLRQIHRLLPLEKQNQIVALTSRAEAYEALHKQVLARDNWRCQNCATSENLQVHYIRSRSKLGDDSPENLITLCATCHDALHRNHQNSI